MGKTDEISEINAKIANILAAIKAFGPGGYIERSMARVRFLDVDGLEINKQYSMVVPRQGELVWVFAHNDYKRPFLRTGVANTDDYIDAQQSLCIEGTVDKVEWTFDGIIPKVFVYLIHTKVL